MFRADHQEWYLIAAPLLYSTPEVDDLGTFLLGWDRSVLPGSSLAGLSDRELLERGNTKLPLLRHTRRLRLVINNVWQGPAYKDEPRAAVEAELLRRDTIMDSAVDQLYRRSYSDVLPQLAKVTLSAPDNFDKYGHYNHSGTPALGLKVICRLRPRFLCETWSSNKLFKTLPVRFKDWQDRTLPDVHAFHADFGFNFGVMWGTANTIFVDFERRLRELEGKPIHLKSLLDWAWPDIAGSVPLSARATFLKSPCHDMDKHTTIDFHGLVSHQVLDWAKWTPVTAQRLRSFYLEADRESRQEDVPDPVELEMDAEGAETWLARLMEKYIAYKCWWRIGGPREFWRKMIKVSTSKEAVSCPACGV